MTRPERVADEVFTSCGAIFIGPFWTSMRLFAVDSASLAIRSYRAVSAGDVV